MGSFGDYTYEDIAESSPGAGASTAAVRSNPGEKIKFIVKRTDGAGAGDAWKICIEESIEDTPDWAVDPPSRSLRQKGTQMKRAFTIAGGYDVRVTIINDDSDTDTVAATVGWRKDGVNR